MPAWFILPGERLKAKDGFRAARCDQGRVPLTGIPCVGLKAQGGVITTVGRRDHGPGCAKINSYSHAITS